MQQLCKSRRTCFKFHCMFYCMFYFTCDRSFTVAVSRGIRHRADRDRYAASHTHRVIGWPWPLSLWPWFIPHRNECIGPHSDAIPVYLELPPPLLPPQVSPIIDKSLLTMLLQLVRGRPGPLLNPGTSQCSACWGMRCWYIGITVSRVLYVGDSECQLV